MKVAAISLGCAKNRIDSEEILGMLAAQGHLICSDSKDADLILVNTCAFIEAAQQESINTLLQEGAAKGKKTLLVALGCLPQVSGPRLLAHIPELNGLIGVHSYAGLEKAIRRLQQGQRLALLKLPTQNYAAWHSRLLTEPGHSVNVKVAEGCSNRCAYCLIPRIRGPYRSRNKKDIIAEIKAHLKNGAKEINLIAQDTTAYGSDQKFKGLPGEAQPESFSGLVEAILAIEEQFWLRILYTYPARIDNKLIGLIKKDGRLLNYLDLPIQHAADGILKAMNRIYSQDDLSILYDRLRKELPGLVLRTTVMTGFPGESRRHFGELLDFMASRPFERLGAFTYSAMKETPAAVLPGQLNERVKKRRLQELLSFQQQIAHALNRKLIGKKLTVLTDERISDTEKGISTKKRRLNSTLQTGAAEPDLRNRRYLYRGRYYGQAPGVDGSVYFRSRFDNLAGSFVTATIVGAGPYNLLGAEAKPLSKNSREALIPYSD